MSERQAFMRLHIACQCAEDYLVEILGENQANECQAVLLLRSAILEAEEAMLAIGKGEEVHENIR